MNTGWQTESAVYNTYNAKDRGETLIPSMGHSSKEPTSRSETQDGWGQAADAGPQHAPALGFLQGSLHPGTASVGSQLPQLHAYTAQLQATRNLVNVCEISWGLLANKCKCWLKHGG